MFRLNMGFIAIGSFRFEPLVAIGLAACAAFGNPGDAQAATFYGFSGIPNSAGAGTNLNVTVSAMNESGELATDYHGQAHFSSSDPLADLPAPTNFMSGTCDVQVTLRTAGEQTVTAADMSNPSLFGTASISVMPGPAASYLMSGLDPVLVAGTRADMTMVVKDEFENVATNYTGLARITSSDPQAVLPSSVHFTAGTAPFQVQLRSGGTRTITATDTRNANITVTLTTTVTAGAMSSFAFSPNNLIVTAGKEFSPTASSVDAFGNRIASYSGAAAVLSSDALAVLPGTQVFVGGTRSFPVTLKTAGSQTITVTDTSGFTGTATLTVRPGTASTLALSGLADAIQAGRPTRFDLTAKDAFGNTATGFSGQLSFSSSDPDAVLPTNAAATAGLANGLAVTFKTVGTQTLTVADGASGSIVGSASTSVTATEATPAAAPPNVGCGCTAPNGLAPAGWACLVSLLVVLRRAARSGFPARR